MPEESGFLHEEFTFIFISVQVVFRQCGEDKLQVMKVFFFIFAVNQQIIDVGFAECPMLL